MRRGLLVAVVAGSLALAAGVTDACTVAVVAASATPDGRPLLWKNRDSDSPANQLMHFQGERFAFIGLVNEATSDGKEVWAGVNAAGFCVMNSASYNLYPADEKEKTEKRRKDEEGFLMTTALGRCATVEDFARLLDETRGDRGVEANFGVIDAQGGAAFFETTNEGFVRFDAADRRVAPGGYLLRTNFSFTGTPNQGAGEIRFDRSSVLFHRALAGGGVDRDWLLLTASRDMVNGLTESDPLAADLPLHALDHRYYFSSDTLVREAATATVLFQGVKAAEDPARTTLWARLGHPLCSVVLPQWVAAGSAMPLTSGTATAPIVRFAQYWYRRVFPFAGSSRERYLDLAPVVNRQGDGLLLKLTAVEREVLRATDEKLQAKAAVPVTVVRVQREVEELAQTRLRQAFPEACAAVGL
jgi:hypothetical protein